jgi:hypothetical protein
MESRKLKKLSKIFLAIILIFMNIPAFGLEKLSLPLLNVDRIEVYKPTKFTIGQTSKFIIKAKPNQTVLFLTSDKNYGLEKYLGQNLRLGSIKDKIEIKTQPNGIAQVDLAIPNDKTLVGKYLFFETLVWDNGNINSVKIAQIMSAASRESQINAIIICDSPKNLNTPTFDPIMPGTTQGLSDAFGKRNYSAEEEDKVEGLELQYSNQTPAILRNMDAPDKE